MTSGVSYRTKAEVWKAILFLRKRQEMAQMSRELFSKSQQVASNITHKASGLALARAHAQHAGLSCNICQIVRKSDTCSCLCLGGRRAGSVLGEMKGRS